jgi:flavin reductase (NADH)
VSQLDRRTFLDIMRSTPSGVTVVTTADDEGRPYGLTVSTACIVSADPPLLLVCIDSRSRTLARVRASGRFAINFLRGDRATVARRFSSPVPDRFEGVDWRPTTEGVPVLVADSVSFAACRVVDDVVAGDHVILIGLAEEGAPPEAETPPLAYFRREYGPWSAPAHAPAPDRPPSDRNLSPARIARAGVIRTSFAARD